MTALVSWSIPALLLPVSTCSQHISKLQIWTSYALSSTSLFPTLLGQMAYKALGIHLSWLITTCNLDFRCTKLVTVPGIQNNCVLQTFADPTFNAQFRHHLLYQGCPTSPMDQVEASRASCAHLQNSASSPALQLQNCLSSPLREKTVAVTWVYNSTWGTANI